ncbi:MAG TPA: carboxypeptidase-like regulatory domain-containing protein [Chryseosolibacter sp.]
MNKVVILFFTITHIFVSAQPKVLQIQGIVRDIATKNAVPFASIGITNTTRGTAANANGEFNLVIRPDEINNRLKISCIGYLTRFYKINESLSGQTMFDLESDVKVLDEITVSESAINPVHIVKGAIDSLQTNYRTEPFNLEFYSTLIVTNAITNQQFTLETLVLGYSKGYGQTARKKFEIVRKRADGKNPFATEEYYFWPTVEIHWADVISNAEKRGVLNFDNLDKFEFAYSGISIYDADTVYKIDYHAPKPTKKLTGYGIVPRVYKGSIYITTNSNAIVWHAIHTDQFEYSIAYKRMDDKYFPYLIQGSRKLKGRNSFLDVKNSIILTNLIFDNVKVIDYVTNEFSNAATIPDDNEYWELNHPKPIDK